MRTALALAVFTLTAAGACAPMDGAATGASTAGQSPRQCFDVRQVSNYRQGDTGQLYLRVGRSAVYELSAAGGCTDLDFAQRVALIPDGIGGSRLCTDDWARVVVPGSTSANTVCRVRLSRQLTPEQVAAIPERQRP
ncbi:MAG TPA: DUF6491 family protein [Brevundimonas sp.]|jgi:hypothetical protein|uniref:DUF6491 family protein n=1 Tax=Brevundimonas sp. TaxID=1871086 RepID=UPI002ED86E1F